MSITNIFGNSMLQLPSLETFKNYSRPKLQCIQSAPGGTSRKLQPLSGVWDVTRGNRSESRTNYYSMILSLTRDGERKVFTPCSLMRLARKVDKTEQHQIFFFFQRWEAIEMRSIEEQNGKERSRNQKRGRSEGGVSKLGGKIGPRLLAASCHSSINVK